MKGKVRGRAKPPLVMRKELTQEIVTYGTDLLCPGLPIQNSLYPQLRAVHGMATFILDLASDEIAVLFLGGSGSLIIPWPERLTGTVSGKTLPLYIAYQFD